MLLERLDDERSLGTVRDDHEALRILSELLARLVAVPAPPRLRQLRDIATGMLREVTCCDGAGPGDGCDLVNHPAGRDDTPGRLACIPWRPS